MRLSKKQIAILVGTILGDGYLQKTGKQNARLRLEHKLEHKDYLLWKIKFFPKLFQGRFTTLERIHPITRKKYRYVRYQSNATKELGNLRRIFYPEGKKKIPSNLERWIKSPLTLAVWYMDDGYRLARDRSGFLYLGRVTREEAEIARKALQNNFRLKAVKLLDKKLKGFVLYFPPAELLKLEKIVAPYILPVMSYKFPS